MFKLYNFNSLQLYLTFILYSFLYLHRSVTSLYKFLRTFKFRRKQITNEKFYEIYTSLQTLPYLYCLDYIFLMKNNNQNLDVAPNNVDQKTVEAETVYEDIDNDNADQETIEAETVYEDIDTRPPKPKPWLPSLPSIPENETFSTQKKKLESMFFHNRKKWEFLQKLRDVQNEKIKQQIQTLSNQQKLKQKLKDLQNQQAKQKIQKLINQEKTQGQEKKVQDGGGQGFQFVKVFISHFKKWLGLFLKSLTSLYYLMPIHLWIIYGLLLFSLYWLICSFCKKLFGDGKKTYFYLISWKKFSFFLMLNFIINLAFNLYYTNYPETVFSGILTTSPIIVLLVLFSLWFLWIYAIYELNRKNIEQKKNKQNKNNAMKKKK